MSIRIPSHKNKTDNERRFPCRDEKALPCVVCGKAVHKPETMVYLADGNSRIISPDEVGDYADAGLYAVGADCLKRHPALKPYVVKR